MDMPPTPSLVKMRQNHTSQSVDYNMNHFKDHFNDTKTSIKKMSTVDPKMADQHKQKVAGMLNDMLNQVKGDSMAKVQVKKTGSFKGEPNKLGGGGRFKQMVSQGMSPGLVAYIGRKKLGSSRMAQLAAAGRRRAS